MLPSVKAFLKLKICEEKSNNNFNDVVVLLRPTHPMSVYSIASSLFSCYQGQKGKWSSKLGALLEEKLPQREPVCYTTTAGSSFPFPAHSHTQPGLGHDGIGAGCLAVLGTPSPAQGKISAALENGRLNVNISTEEVVAVLGRIPQYINDNPWDGALWALNLNLSVIFKRDGICHPRHSMLA